MRSGADSLARGGRRQLSDLRAASTAPRVLSLSRATLACLPDLSDRPPLHGCLAWRYRRLGRLRVSGWNRRALGHRGSALDRGDNSAAFG
jgi:hypothetical protein